MQTVKRNTTGTADSKDNQQDCGRLNGPQRVARLQLPKCELTLIATAQMRISSHAFCIATVQDADVSATIASKHMPHTVMALYTIACMNM